MADAVLKGHRKTAIPLATPSGYRSPQHREPFYSKLSVLQPQ